MAEKYHIFKDLNRKRQGINFKMPPLILTSSQRRWHHRTFVKAHQVEKWRVWRKRFQSVLWCFLQDTGRKVRHTSIRPFSIVSEPQLNLTKEKQKQAWNHWLLNRRWRIQGVTGCRGWNCLKAQDSFHFLALRILASSRVVSAYVLITSSTPSNNDRVTNVLIG